MLIIFFNIWRLYFYIGICIFMKVGELGKGDIFLEFFSYKIKFFLRDLVFVIVFK